MTPLSQLNRNLRAGLLAGAVGGLCLGLSVSGVVLIALDIVTVASPATTTVVCVGLSAVAAWCGREVRRLRRERPALINHVRAALARPSGPH